MTTKTNILVSITPPCGLSCSCNEGSAELNPFFSDMGLHVNKKTAEALNVAAVTGTLTWFARIFVKPEFRGQGYGSLLISRMMDEVKARKWSVVCYINPYGDLTREQLRDFYVRHGFVVHNKGQEDEVLTFIP